jgi:integrase
MPAYKGEDGRWRYRFTYKGERHGGSTPRSANTKANAIALERQHLDKLVARLNLGEVPTIAKFAPQYLDFQREHTKPLTYLNQEHIVRLHIVPTIGKLKLDDVTVHVIDGLKTTWREADPTLAPGTTNLRLRVLRRLLNVALDWEILARVPKFKMLKDQRENPRFLSDAEQVALIAAATIENLHPRTAAADRLWGAMIVVALRTGMRIGELRGLQWGDIDLDRRRLSVQRSETGKAGVKGDGTKGGRNRTLPLSADAVAAFRSIPRQTRRSDELVWKGRGGGRGLSEAACDGAITRIVNRAKLEKPEEIGWHSLRHTFASQLAIRGVSLRAIQELLGHSSIQVTEIYAHLLPGTTHLDEVSRLDFPMLSTPPAPRELGPGTEDPAPPRQRDANEPRGLPESSDETDA